MKLALAMLLAAAAFAQTTQTVTCTVQIPVTHRYQERTPALGAADGKNATFTTAHAATESGDVEVFKNGLLQALYVDYSLAINAGSTQVIFSPGAAPENGDTVVVIYRSAH